MAITEDELTVPSNASPGTIDGVELTPKTVGLDGIPSFDNVEDERHYRKTHLAGALRIFGKFGFGEGVAGHITVRDPEYPDMFWVNPFGMSFRHIRQSDLILVDHSGNVVYGTKPVNRAAFVIHAAVHAARPDVVAAAHAHSPYGKSFSSLGIPLAPLTQDACIFYKDHHVISEQGGAVVFDVEAVHRTRDGKTLHVTVSAIPTFGADGRIESVLGVCTDITAQKRRERDLAVALRNQQVIFDAAGEGIAFVQSGRIEKANGALAQMLGVQLPWLNGRPASDILADAEDWQRVLEITRAAAQRGESANHEVMLRAPEGSAGTRGVWSQLTARMVGVDGEAEAMILVATDITPLKQREELAWHQANHDELTGLPNRRLLGENARRLLSVAMRRDRRAALMVLDLDGFKEVNDAFGHAYGDAMLRRVAMRMSMTLREYDLIARIGGDEFVVLLPEIDDPDVARRVAEKLIGAASEDVEFGERPSHMGASVGIAVFPTDGQDFDTLLRRADAAMYASKQAGKNRCTFAPPLHGEPVIPPAPRGLRPH